MTNLSNDTVLRLAAKVGARIMHDHETQEEKLCFPVGAVHEFAALIQAELEMPKKLKSVSEELADALRPFVAHNQKVIWRMPFRWVDDNGVLSNHYDGMGVDRLAEDFNYEIVFDAKDAAIVRNKS